MQFDYWQSWGYWWREWLCRARRQHRWRWSFRWDSLLRRCRCTSSRFVRAKATSGRRVIGRGMTTIRIITGCQEPGSWRHKLDICGRRAIGDGAAKPTFSTWVTGDQWLDSMAELTMAGATPDADIMADGGTTTIFITTAK